MNQKAEPLPQTQDQHLSSSTPTGCRSDRTDTKPSVFSVRTAAQDELFRDFGFPLMRAYRLLLSDCLFTQLGKVASRALAAGVGQQGTRFLTGLASA